MVPIYLVYGMAFCKSLCIALKSVSAQQYWSIWRLLQDEGSHQQVVELVQPPHQGMFLAFLQWSKNKSASWDDDSRTSIKCQAAILGAGCGALPNALVDIDSGVHVQVDCVELDPDVLLIGKKYFGFIARECLQIHSMNATEFIDTSPASYFDAIFLDAASMRASRQLTAPPDELCNRQFFVKLSSIIAPGGFLVTNIVGDVGKLHQVYDLLSSAFKHIWCLRLPSQVLIYTSNDESWVENMKLMDGEISSRVRGLVCSTLEQINIHDSTKSNMGWLNQASLRKLLSLDNLCD